MPSRNTAELTAAPAGRPGEGRAADSARACRSGAHIEPAACLARLQTYGVTRAVSLPPVVHQSSLTASASPMP